MTETRRPLPVDKAKAREVLAQHGLDGLIALRPHNVYYLSNEWPVVTDFRSEFPAMATFAREEAAPSFYIGTNGSAWDLLNGEKEAPEIITFAGAANASDYQNATAEQMRIEPQSFGALSNGFAVDRTVALSPREQVWRDCQETYLKASAPSIEWALVRALKQSGLLNGVVAADDMRVAYLLQRIGIDTVTIVPGDNIFREIRLVKQAHEIELIAKAQVASQAAALAAARSLAPGMTFREARREFIKTAADHDADIEFLLLGVTQGFLPDGVVKEGRSYMIDCGASHHHYMGDFARTISIGEPSKTLQTRFKAQQIGRAEAFERLRPGMRFAEVEAIGREAMIKAGMPADVLAACYLHSVGLQHDDQPTRPDNPYNVRGDMRLEAGMCLTLDLPFMEIGWGAGHNEDMILITETGYTLLNSPNDPLVVV